MKLVAVCAVLLSALVANSCAFMEDCKWPSEFWCTDQTIAKACGVSSHCRAIDAINTQYASGVSGDAPLVDFGLYYESLSPESRQFITQQFVPTWNQVSSIINITIVPYGKAKESPDFGFNDYECEHGQDECIGNFFAACALIYYKIDTVVQFIGCLAASNVSSMDKAAEQCAAKFPDYNFSRLEECVFNPYFRVKHEMAVKTESLVPKLTYVPWVTLNGVHTEEIQQKAQDDLLGLICATYQGSKPDACTKRAFGGGSSSSAARGFVQRPNIL